MHCMVPPDLPYPTAHATLISGCIKLHSPMRRHCDYSRLLTSEIDAKYSRAHAVPCITTVPPGTVSSVPFPMVRKLQARLKKYVRMLIYRLGLLPQYLLGYFLSINALLLWIPGHNSVPGNVTYIFCCDDGLLLHIIFYGGWWIHTSWYLDITVPQVITFIFLSQWRLATAY